MIAVMPKKIVRHEEDSRKPRTGVVTAATVKAFMADLQLLIDQAEGLLPMFAAVEDGEAIVDGVGLSDRGTMQCGVFLDNVRTALRRKKAGR